MRSLLPRKDQFRSREIEGFQFDREVGRGNNGVVYRASKPLGASVSLDVAVKLIPTGNLRPGYEAEFEKVALLSGVPQVVGVREQFETDLDGAAFACVCYDFVDGVDLQAYVRDNPSSVTLPFVDHLVGEVLRAMFAMREAGVNHGDLHAGNIMVAEAPLVYGSQPVVRITDFGVGGSHNGLEPKDDYLQLALVCRDVLLDVIDYAELDHPRDRAQYNFYVDEFIPKRLVEENTTVGEFVREPAELIGALEAQVEAVRRRDWARTASTLTSPFEYLSCEQISDSFELLQKLYTSNFPGYEDLLKRSNTILTGPRGCGKTTIFRNLSLKTRLLGGSATLDDVGDYVGVYYHCSDLYFTFSHVRKRLSELDADLVVHYFNLNLLREIVDTLAAAQSVPDGAWTTGQEGALQEFVEGWLPGYRRPPIGTPVLDHLRSYVEGGRHDVYRLLKRRRRRRPDALLPAEFLARLCERLQEIVPWLGGRPFYFLLDDFSTPHVSEQMQAVLNDAVMRRGASCFFKVSTESIVSFHPYDSTGKLMEAGREYDTVDLGAHFIHKKAAEGGGNANEERRRFVVEVLNNRLQNTAGIDPTYHDIEVILGDSNTSYNEMARKIKAGDGTVHYYGTDVLTDLFSGDIADILRIVQSVFRLAGGYEAMSRPGAVHLPIGRATQDKAIRQYGGAFLDRIEAAPTTGPHLRRVVNAFGEVAHEHLKQRTSKNQTASPPWQAFRIEIRESPPLDDPEALNSLYNALLSAGERRNVSFASFRDKVAGTYRDLLRYGVFLRDVRGKSQRGHVVPRLYLRRLLIPTYRLTPSQRDSVSMEPSDFVALLFEPKIFADRMRRRFEAADRDDRQTDLFPTNSDR